MNEQIMKLLSTLSILLDRIERCQDKSKLVFYNNLKIRLQQQIVELS